MARKLLKCKVCVLVPAEDCPKDTEGNLMTGGLFGVAHKPTSDRLINDRRPFNAGERRLGWARLPCGVQLCQLVVGDGEEVVASGDD